MYDNLRDVERYLHDSIIRVNKSPVMVEDAYMKGRVVWLRLQYLRSGKRKDIAITDPSLNFKPVPLGYGVDDLGRVFFSYRLPRRRWKQGLHLESFGCLPQVGGGLNINTSRGRKALVNTIQGKFSSFQDAFKNGGIFHRHFRIIKEGAQRILEYKGEYVGEFQGEHLKLRDEYSYLETYAGEVMV